MFYCDSCRKAKGWPESIAQSFGACELCGNGRYCHDVPSSILPEAPPKSNNQASYLHVATTLNKVSAELSRTVDLLYHDPLDGDFMYLLGELYGILQRVTKLAAGRSKEG